MILYQTPENFQKSYGGAVTAPDAEMGKDGTLRIPFSREVVFPEELII